MAESQVTICNKALAICGISEKISAITEVSPEADECEKAYDSILDETLGQFDWSFARRLATLTTAAGTPPEPWAHQYSLPSGMVRALRIDDRVSVRQSRARIPFTYMTNDSGSRLLLTNVDEAKLWYTHRTVTVALYPFWFVQALSFQLAAEICMPLTSNEKLQQTIRSRALNALSRGIAQDAEDGQEDPEPEASWVDFRDGPINRSQGIAAHDFDYF